MYINLNIFKDKTNKNIISWTVDGKKVIIHNLPLFKEHILPSYFKSGNYSSF